jgi:hypothetical protein
VDNFQYLNMLPVVKLPANSLVLISLYQQHSHTWWIADKSYHFSQKQLHADMFGYMRIVYWGLTDSLDNVAGLTWWLHRCVMKDCLTNPVAICNLIDGVKEEIQSLWLMTVHITINTATHKYTDTRSWNDLQFHNPGFISFSLPRATKSVFSCTQKWMRG